jgi:FMN reductase
LICATRISAKLITEYAKLSRRQYEWKSRKQQPAHGPNRLRLAQESKVNCEWLDISKLDLPMCDADVCYNHPAAKNITAAIERADGIMVATPVYNYDVSAAAKNMVELTGSAWEDKVVAFLCAAGGMGSYMSVMSFANSLMLDFRCLIIPRFVYATGDSFNGDKTC